jgi:hypothetical protein
MLPVGRQPFPDHPYLSKRNRITPTAKKITPNTRAIATIAMTIAAKVSIVPLSGFV